ncbi:unnamed protein product [Sphagnum troendelagicum]|uniref:C2H2-type domain-containing protein n=1 Tax=Sphagnum troendelagicum TaxID=128251 RepID=A0ABP0TVW0_9BRYO
MARGVSSGDSRLGSFWMTKVRVGSSKEAAAAAARRRRSHHKKTTTTSSPSHKKIKSNDLLPVSTSGGNPDSASFDEPTRTRTRRIKVVKEHPSAARLVISSTDYTGSETIGQGDDNHEEAFLIKSWEKLATMRNKQDGGGGHKNLQAPPPTLKSSSFVFQKRLSRIDWRTIHAIDVDQVIRDIDIDTLETVLDTIAFGDIQGEDTRNFTEANFVKLFRLSQLMVEYLLHVQELLAIHKSELILAGASMQQRGEKLRAQCVGQRAALLQSRHELKQARKTMKTYEVMLKMQGKCHMQSNTQQVRHCPFCEKMFESSYYLDFHIARRHPKTQEIIMEDKLLEVVSKAEEATAARLKAETAIAMQTEIQQLREKSQVDLQRAEMSANAQVKTLQAELRQSNVQLQELQSCLQLLQSQFLSAPQPATRHVQYTSDLVKEKDSGPEQERLYELETKFTALECQVKSLGQENLRLLKELDTAYNEVSDLRSGKEHSLAKLEIRVGELRMENQHLKKTMHKMEGEQFEILLKGKHGGGMSAEKRSRTPDTDQALLALARPISGRQRQELFMKRLEKTRSPDSSPEKEKYRHSSSPAKQASCAAAHLEQAYETSPDRKGLRSNPLQEKSRHSQESRSWVKNCRQPQNAEELKAQLEEDMLTAHAEEERRKKAVQRLLLKEKGKDRAHDSNTRKVQRRQDKDDGLHSYTHRTKSEAHGGSEEDYERHAMEQEDEEAHKFAEIAEVAAMDVGEEAPVIAIPEKQKWLKEHPYVPIPTLPHVVAKYPHPPSAFKATFNEIADQFDEQLHQELKKFGITPTASGISDTAYTSVSMALEKQRSQRMAQVHGSERRLMEYERGAILWHTQRAVHDRDLEIIEAHFDIATECSSGHQTGDSDGNESEQSNYSSSRSHQSESSKGSDGSREAEEEKERDKKSSKAKDSGYDEKDHVSGGSSSGHSNQQSNVGGGSSSSEKETKNSSKTQATQNAKSPPDRRVQYVSNAFSSKSMQKREGGKGETDLPPSRGELIIMPPKNAIEENLMQKMTATTVQTVEEEEEAEDVEEELGLGNWDSEDDEHDASSSLVRSSQRKIVNGRPEAVSVLSALKGKDGPAAHERSGSSPLQTKTPPTRKSISPLKAHIHSMSSTTLSPPRAQPKASPPMVRSKGNAVDIDSNGSEERKIMNELTSEIDEIVSS